MRCRYPKPAQQRGAALIIALLVVAIVVLLAASTSSDFLVLFRKVENQLHSQQAAMYLQGAETVARQVLLVDSERSPDFDNASEGWLNEPMQYPMDYGSVGGLLVDLQGRFNINNLVVGTATSGNYTVDQQRFIRLLQSLPVEPNIDLLRAEEITNAVIDWMDSDSTERSPGGAEGYFYSAAEPPRRPANRSLVSVSELRWVNGISAEIYAQLEPFLTVWPVNGGNLNINTMDPRLLVIFNQAGTLSPLNDADVQTLLDAREQNGGFDAVEDFAAIAGLPADLDFTAVGVKSNYFLLLANTQFLDRTYRSQTVLYRDDNSVKVVARSQGGF